MIKKIILGLILCFLIISCGKKGCPMDPSNETNKCNPVFKL